MGTNNVSTLRADITLAITLYRHFEDQNPQIHVQYDLELSATCIRIIRKQL